MNYLLLIYQNENDLNHDDPAFARCVKTCEGLVERLHAEEQYVAGGILKPTAAAASVRVRDGQTLVTDGPFAETREQLGGYLLIRADSLDDALAVAVQHPIVHTGTVEVRPLYEIPYLA